MSFAIRLQARYAAAKVQFVASEGTLQAKAERLVEVVGNKQVPIQLADLDEGFERAVKHGMSRQEAERLKTVLDNRFFEPVANDHETYADLLGNFRESVRILIKDISDPEWPRYAEALIPWELRAKLTKEQLEAVLSEIVRYATEVCRFIEAVLTKALLGPHTLAQRIVGLAQALAVSDSFEEMTHTIVAPLENLEP